MRSQSTENWRLKESDVQRVREGENIVPTLQGILPGDVRVPPKYFVFLLECSRIPFIFLFFSRITLRQLDYSALLFSF